ncbi:MAG TPA: RloB family protein [Actinospica sp.]|nr:RloB family protein [Actinospica sp.]
MAKVRKQGAPAPRRSRRAGRDRRRQDVYLAFEGEGTERDYFRAVQETLLRDSGFVLHVAPNPNGFTTARRVVEAVVELRGDDDAPAWAICDLDDKADHDPQDVARAVRAARKSGVTFVLCNPCFEVWLHLHFATRSAAFGDQKKAIDELRKLHPAFADYAKREGGGKRLTPRRLAALFEDDNLAQACRRAQKLHDRCEREDCDHLTKPGQACPPETRDPSSPLHELFALLRLDVAPRSGPETD